MRSFKQNRGILGLKARNVIAQAAANTVSGGLGIQKSQALQAL